MSQAKVLLSSSVSFSVSVRWHAPDARRWLYDRAEDQISLNEVERVRV